MSEREQANEHRADVPGTARPDDPPPSTEHRDTAYGNASERNEIHPEERRDEPPTGPTTHDDTRFTRKGEE